MKNDIPIIARDNLINHNEAQVKSKEIMTHDFSPEVHMLAGTLVSVVSTVHFVVRELIGTMPIPTLGRCKNLPTSEGNSMT
jgi:hypothetical protein